MSDVVTHGEVRPQGEENDRQSGVSFPRGLPTLPQGDIHEAKSQKLFTKAEQLCELCE